MVRWCLTETIPQGLNCSDLGLPHLALESTLETPLKTLFTRLLNFSNCFSVSYHQNFYIFQLYYSSMNFKMKFRFQTNIQSFNDIIKAITFESMCFSKILWFEPQNNEGFGHKIMHYSNKLSFILMFLI